MTSWTMSQDSTRRAVRRQPHAHGSQDPRLVAAAELVKRFAVALLGLFQQDLRCEGVRHRGFLPFGGKSQNPRSECVPDSAIHHGGRHWRRPVGAETSPALAAWFFRLFPAGDYGHFVAARHDGESRRNLRPNANRAWTLAVASWLCLPVGQAIHGRRTQTAGSCRRLRRWPGASQIRRGNKAGVRPAPADFRGGARSTRRRIHNPGMSPSHRTP